MNQIINNILKAKEARAQRRMKIAEKNLPSVSVNLNIPGYPKSDDEIQWFFQHVLQNVKRFLLSHRVSLLNDQEYCACDEAGDFYIVPVVEIQAKDLKQIAELFEAEHALGRLIDVDITDEKGNPVSSGKAKTCFYCDQQPAIYCMRTQSHSYEEMREKISGEIQVYRKQVKKEKLCKGLSTLALKALLHEVALAPKPGLVDRFSSGSHTDMDFATFVNSSAVLSAYFQQIVAYGFTFEASDIKLALPSLRQFGLQMEEDMFAETNGVNTHKGAIFLLGFSLFTSAYLMAKDAFSYDAFVSVIREMNGNLVERELGKKLYANDKTHGEVCFEKYGKKGQGIRGEIQAGLPSVFQHAIPVLEQHLSSEQLESDALLNQALTHTLLALIAYNDDSNILYRKGEQVLEELKQHAQQAFDVFDTDLFEQAYQKLINFCNEKHISPGGSADLLAVSYFICKAKQKFSKS
jgi:holo-ACP synthase/triphosphoribosyl-dephospho-CoA synthase